jgi:hypothetical protein
MNVSTFFRHYGIDENPFRAEEARHDAVFNRVDDRCFHPDFEKICGEFDRPGPAIVFGERGSGKTAIRLQIQHQLEAFNASHPEGKCLPLVYDELNPVLDRFTRHVGRAGSPEALKRLALVDHIDAILNAAVPVIVDRILGDRGPAAAGPGGAGAAGGSIAPGSGGAAGAGSIDLGGDAAKRARHMDAATKHDLLVLQACYDRPEVAGHRTRRLRNALRYRAARRTGLLRWLAIVVGVAAVAALVWSLILPPAERLWAWNATIFALALAAAAFGAGYLWLWTRSALIARDLARRLRVVDRPAASFRESLATLHTNDLLASRLPRSDDDDLRYAMLSRLLNVIRSFGYASIMVLIDRLDEPTLVNGEPARMQSVVWPMLNSKFLQQERIGVKLLLPLELHYLLARESPEFFRGARLDKQNMIERLQWSGAVLYDLCTARLNACRREAAAEPGRDGAMALRDLFDASVTHQDLVDALDQMQQPRDAFKLLYQVVQEHCSNVPDAKPQWTIPRLVLDAVRKRQAERLGAMLRGTRPG